MGLLGRGKNDTNTIGDISEAAIITRFLQLGYFVLTPYGGNHRYDLVIEDVERRFWRIQCKTARIVNNAIIKFDTANHNVTGNNRECRHYRGECDYFAVYSPGFNKVYLVPVDEVGVATAILRLTPLKNNQEKNVRWAKDYEL
ncbi:hypothetical protein KSC_038860 [Ktedonobacter sp. SOSP1-52]|uniref:group I intron-associated PD-(D/E)XK endonuclease n=1 Tax=Ktedonobacter sp. SOSP1-52 TaxID=2778366 RepID=UPI0019159B2D|nr:group I intron-associated PD-(D/E)XK endonuclease [Ktedonobacter sp. SOSP1-52]GHO64994.1 hypothetical protein KSC_038860 [Ktedonobacter sp. SOSP1-52]